MSKKKVVETNILAPSVGVKDENGDWSSQTKYEVVSLWLSTGNLRQACRLVQVPYETVVDWRKKDWWPTLVDEVKSTRRAELNSRLGAVVEGALAKVQDRLENGDFILNNKTGEIVRRPVNMKETARMLNDILNTQIKLEKADQEAVQSPQSMPDLLKTLASEFAKFNRRQENKNVIDVEFKEVKDAVHDKREAGLQEGSS